MPQGFLCVWSGCIGMKLANKLRIYHPRVTLVERPPSPLPHFSHANAKSRAPPAKWFADSPIRKRASVVGRESSNRN
jgi:hypothetical protein